MLLQPFAFLPKWSKLIPVSFPALVNNVAFGHFTLVALRISYSLVLIIIIYFLLKLCVGYI